MFKNKNILVTGGTGSFGRRFIGTILDSHKPNKLVVYSRDEYKQYEMSSEIKSDAIRFFIGDVRDKERLAMAMRDIDIVVHCAALKQVPASEYNPMECIKTNIHGAENVIDAAIKNNVKKVIALSTDKAANPINLYGATKLVSDKLFVAANNIVGDSHTRFSVVRYGNVVGSRGSVIPLFKKLHLNNAKTYPITDLNMTRFLITLQQGVDFVISCLSYMQGGEIFVPKLPSVLISDIAKAINPDAKFEIIGIRPGEKIHEVMCPKDDSHLTIEFQNYFLIKPAIKFTDSDIDYLTNIKDNSLGKLMSQGFSYNSRDNKHFLSINEIKKINLEEVV